MMYRHFLMAAALLTLTACGGGKPAPDLYVLRAAESETPKTCNLTRTIILARPKAPNEYDTKRIAVMLDRNHLSYYTGAAWAAPFPEQLQDFLSDALTQRGIDVVEDADGHATTLHIAIREASVTNVNAPVVRLRLTGSIGKKHFTVNESVTAEQNHMPQIIDAYGTAATHAADIILKALNPRCTDM